MAAVTNAVVNDAYQKEIITADNPAGDSGNIAPIAEEYKPSAPPVTPLPPEAIEEQNQNNQAEIEKARQQAETAANLLRSKKSSQVNEYARKQLNDANSILEQHKQSPVADPTAPVGNPNDPLKSDNLDSINATIMELEAHKETAAKHLRPQIEKRLEKYRARRDELMQIKKLPEQKQATASDPTGQQPQQPMFDITTTISSSTTSIPKAYMMKVEEQMKKAESALSEQKSLNERYLESQKTLNDREKKNIDDGYQILRENFAAEIAAKDKQAKRWEALDKELGEESAYLKNLRRKNDEMNERTVKQLSNFVADPLRDTSPFAVAMLALGSIAEAYTARKEKRAPVNMFGAFIEQKRQDEAARYNRLTNMYKITAEKGESLNKRVNEILDRKEAVTTALAKLELDKIASESNSKMLTIRATEAKILLDRKAQALELSMKNNQLDKEAKMGTEHAKLTADIAPKTTTSVVKQITPGQGSASKKIPQDKLQTELGDRTLTIKKLMNIEKGIEESGYGMLGRHIPNKDANRLRQVYIVPFLAEMRKSIESGVMTENDWKRYKDILDSTFLTADEVMRRLQIIKKDLQAKQESSLKNGKYYYDLTPFENEYRELTGEKRESNIPGVGK